MKSLLLAFPVMGISVSQEEVHVIFEEFQALMVILILN